MSDNARQFANAVLTRIRSERESLGLTQVQVAQRLGMSDSGYSMWESGDRQISVEDLKRIADVLSRPVGYFLGDEWTVYFRGVVGFELSGITLEELTEAVDYIKFRKGRQGNRAT